MNRFIAALILNILILSSSLSAQDLAGRFNVSPYAGIGIPMGELADDNPYAVLNGDAAFRKTGLKFGANAEYFFSSSLGIALSFRYVSFGSKDIEITGYNLDSKSKITAVILGIQAKYAFMPSNTVRPYVLGGVGIYGSTFIDFDALLFDLVYTDRIDVDVDTRFYTILGGGAMYFVSPAISIFGEVTLDYILTDGASLKYKNLELGILGSNYYFVDIVAGINIWFGGSE
jgi:hypothetical protein